MSIRLNIPAEQGINISRINTTFYMLPVMKGLAGTPK